MRGTSIETPAAPTQESQPVLASSSRNETKSLIVTLHTKPRNQEGGKSQKSISKAKTTPETASEVRKSLPHRATSKTKNKQDRDTQPSVEANIAKDMSTMPKDPQESRDGKASDENVMARAKKFVNLIEIFSRSIEEVEAWTEQTRQDIENSDDTESCAESDDDAETAATSPIGDVALGILPAKEESDVRQVPHIFGQERVRFPREPKEATVEAVWAKLGNKPTSKLFRLDEIQPGDDEDVSSQFEASRAASPSGSGQPTEAPSQVPSPAPGGASADSQSISHQLRSGKSFVFSKISNPSEYAELVDSLGDVEKLSDAQLFWTAEGFTSQLVQLQDQYNQLKLIIDDEANAVRRQAQEESLIRAEAGGTRYPRREDRIEIKGLRQPKTEDPVVTKAREQDRLEADVYFYQYDPRDSMIGAQDPLLQREGLGSARLRSRPKQSTRAAEADDSVMSKRTRKPRQFPDAVPEPTRRSSRQMKSKNNDEEAALEEPSQPKAKRGRRPKVAEVADEGGVEEEGQPTPAPESSQKSMVAPDAEGEQQPLTDGRKRKRRPGRSPGSSNKNGAATSSAGQEPIIKVNGSHVPEAPTTQDTKQQYKRRRIIKVKRPSSSTRDANGVSKDGSRSFEASNASQTDSGARNDSRPGTSSSNETVGTVGSGSYSFRPNRHKQYIDEPDISPIDAPEKPSGGRRKRKTQKAAGAAALEPPSRLANIAPQPTGAIMTGQIGTFFTRLAEPSHMPELAGGGPAPQSARAIIKIRRRSNENGTKPNLGSPSAVNPQSAAPRAGPSMSQQQSQQAGRGPFILVETSNTPASIRSKCKESPVRNVTVTEDQGEESLTDKDRCLLSFLTEDVCREVFKDRSSVPLSAKLVVARELQGRDYFQLDKGKKMSISMKREFSSL